MPSSNELKILDLISQKPAGSQRDFASASGFSLGLTNAILKRLAKTGYIKIHALNSRKVRYILTPKGISEKTRKSIDYIINSIKTFRLCFDRVKALVNEEIKKGRKHFIIVGEGSLADLAELALKEIGGITFEKTNKVLKVSKDSTLILNCRTDVKKTGEIGVSLLSDILDIESMPIQSLNLKLQQEKS